MPESPDQSDMLRKFKEQMEGHARPSFPYGKLCPEDEGQLLAALSLNREGKTIILAFAKPIRWCALRLEEAVGLRAKLTEMIDKLRKLHANPGPQGN